MNTANTFNVKFVVRNERLDKQGKAPIYARIRVNGKKLEITTNLKILPTEWQDKLEIAKATTKENKQINEMLQDFKSRIYKSYSTVVMSGEEITAEAMKAAFINKVAKEEVYYLIETTDEHNRNFEALIGIKYSMGSYKNYKTSLKYYKEFVPLFYKKKDIPLSLVNYKFCEAFFMWLTSIKECKTNGANKQIQRLKKIIHYAMNKGYIGNDPVATYSLENTPVNKIALTMEELHRLQDLTLSRNVLKQVRDVFLFQAYTGLSYGDVKRLTKNDVQLDGKGDYWIRMSRQKTLIAFSVPLLAPVLLILEDYINERSSDEPLLPVLSNQKMNDNLKVIQELAGISKNLTTHLARHTFATTITLSNGVPIETVSRMLGHTKLSTTQMYAKVLDGKIAEDMDALRLKMKNKKGGDKPSPVN